MAGMWGADIQQLRAVAKTLDHSGESLDRTSNDVTVDIMTVQAWKGPSADQFRRTWSGQHRPALRTVAQQLDQLGHMLRLNADAQERASTTYDAVGDLGDPRKWGMFGPDSNLGIVTAVAGTLKTGKKLVTRGIKFTKWGTKFSALTQAKKITDLAVREIAVHKATSHLYKAVGGLHGATARSMGAIDHFGKLGKFGTMMGGVGGGLAVVGGTYQMFNPHYDGARGVVDRVMGGVGVVGGAGSIAIALGGAAMLGPVGVGVVVGAGVVAGAWALGNAVYDNWDAISAFAGDAGGVISGATGEAVDFAQDKAGEAVEAAGDGLKKAGDFIGGLFS